MVVSDSIAGKAPSIHPATPLQAFPNEPVAFALPCMQAPPKRCAGCLCSRHWAGHPVLPPSLCQPLFQQLWPAGRSGRGDRQACTGGGSSGRVRPGRRAGVTSSCDLNDKPQCMAQSSTRKSSFSTCLKTEPSCVAAVCCRCGCTEPAASHSAKSCYTKMPDQTTEDQ